jgi:hydantoinase/carbamoylase family amidase
VTGTAAADVLARCAMLGEVSEVPDGLMRRFATPALASAGEIVVGWMEDAGMTTRRDAVGNLIGRHGAGARPLVLGSHLDTVPNAGTFDGPLGIVAAIAVVERLAAGGPQPSCPVEVVAFADEEGTRFGTSYLGSSAYVGAFEPAWLDHVDGEGVTLRDAIRVWGAEPEPEFEASAPDLAGYLEVHIEQGPVLEREGLPVGVVTAIAGQTRARIVLTGEAGHAGTLPMDARHDALAAAAEAVLAIERRGRAEPGLVATVGALSLSPNVGNVVPGEVRMLLDLRHGDDDVRRRAAEEMRADVERLAALRGVGVEWTTRYDTPAAVLDATLRARLADAVRVQGIPARELVSGAGHDAVVLSRICPAAMLFVRCAAGISHDPRESVSEEDVAVALDVLEHAVRAS